MPPKSVSKTPAKPTTAHTSKQIQKYNLRVVFVQTAIWLSILCFSIFLMVILFRRQWQQIDEIIHPIDNSVISQDNLLSATASVDNKDDTSESLIFDVIRAILSATTEAQLASSASDLNDLIDLESAMLNDATDSSF